VVTRHHVAWALSILYDVIRLSEMQTAHNGRDTTALRKLMTIIPVRAHAFVMLALVLLLPLVVSGDDSVSALASPKGPRAFIDCISSHPVHQTNSVLHMHVRSLTVRCLCTRILNIILIVGFIGRTPHIQVQIQAGSFRQIRQLKEILPARFRFNRPKEIQFRSRTRNTSIIYVP
jgi:hypothetical protein